MFRRLPDLGTLPAREEHWQDFIKNLRLYLHDVVDQLNTQIQDIGPDLVSASVMKPSNALHRVSGTAIIDTIIPPIGFSGFIRFVALDEWSTSLDGNIAALISPHIGTVVLFDYVPAVGKWFPLWR